MSLGLIQLRSLENSWLDTSEAMSFVESITTSFDAESLGCRASTQNKSVPNSGTSTLCDLIPGVVFVVSSQLGFFWSFFMKSSFPEEVCESLTFKDNDWSSVLCQILWADFVELKSVASELLATCLLCFSSMFVTSSGALNLFSTRRVIPKYSQDSELAKAYSIQAPYSS